MKLSYTVYESTSMLHKKLSENNGRRITVIFSHWHSLVFIYFKYMNVRKELLRFVKPNCRQCETCYGGLQECLKRVFNKKNEINNCKRGWDRDNSIRHVLYREIIWPGYVQRLRELTFSRLDLK